MNDTAIQSILAGMKEVERLIEEKSSQMSKDEEKEAERSARYIDASVWELVEYLENVPLD